MHSEPSGGGPIERSRRLEHPRIGNDHLVSLTVADAIDLVRTAPRLTVALRNAEGLAAVAMRSTDPRRDTRRLARAIGDGSDDVTSIAAAHAIGAIADPTADDVLLELLARGEEPLVSHAAWVLAARAPSAAAVPLLLDLVVSGGFTGMLAERTMIEWSRLAPRLVPAPIMLHRRATPIDRSHLGRGRRGDGIVVIQPFLHARLDGPGSSLGAGDAGGIASLLRSLGSSLSRLETVDEVITITRAEPTDRGDMAFSEFLGDDHRIERIPYGSSPMVPWREAWQFRTLLEHEMMAIGRALGRRRVVWHLRMADVGTLAASAVARRLGHPVVFTAAPDPHIVIDALEADGRLDRSRFGIEDAACQYWFRARMVERLSAQVDRLALLPRPGLQRELTELVGLDADDLEVRSSVVPEGVDVGAIDAALRRRPAGPVPAVEAVLAAVPAPRRHLPWILTVGRLHPMKGPHRVVSAVASRTDLLERFNVVSIGGDLADPSPDERSALDLIRLAAIPLDDGVVTVIGHLPPSGICDLLVHAAETGGVYVCASDKEEFGLAIVEALAAGMVVVAPQRGGPRSYIDHGVNGVLCDTSSTTLLADAVEQAAAIAVDRVRIGASRDFVRRELSIDTMAERLAAIYGALVPVAARAA